MLELIRIVFGVNIANVFYCLSQVVFNSISSIVINTFFFINNFINKLKNAHKQITLDHEFEIN